MANIEMNVLKVGNSEFEIADAKARQDVSNLKEDKADIDSVYVTDTASGSIASFPDGADDVPVKSLTVNVEPVQDLHGQANPYPAGGGKNLLPIDSVFHDSTTEGFAIFSGSITGTFTVSVDTSLITSYQESSAALCGVVVDGVAHREISIDVPYMTYTGTITEVWVYGSGAYSKYLGTARFQLEEGSTATAWSPYSNICPISGRTQAKVTRTGKNVWDEEWKVIGDHIGSKNPIPCLPNTAYYMQAPANPSNGLKFWTKDMVQTGATRYNRDLFTTPSDCYYITFEMASAYGTTYNHDISINYPSTDTDYHSGAGNQTYTIDLDGTIYGGTLDVTTGVLTVSMVNVDISTLNYSPSSPENHIFRSDTLHGTIKSPATGLELANAISSSYTQIGYAPISASSNGGFAIATAGTSNDGRLVFVDHRYSTINDFISGNLGTQLVYELATPQTIQLSSTEVRTLLGQNNVFADCGDTTVEYRADTKLYIEKLTAPTEDDLIADHAISTNTFFMIGNTLYRATTAIASGATITVGTNATKLSLSDALNALA